MSEKESTKKKLFIPLRPTFHQIMTIKEIYSLFKQHPTVTTDTRNCKENSIFIALKGDRFNGNEFVEQAIKEGCGYAITDEAKYATGSQIILVDNCLQTLQELASYHRKQVGTPVIGITGSNGKTTTKELLAAVLSTQYNTLYTEGNLNNHIGVPLTLLQLTAEHEVAIIEMGANHPGEIKTLANIALPDYGLITNVGKAHLEGFGSFEGVLKTKGELYDYIRDTQGTVFIHSGNGHLNGMITSGVSKVSYGRNDDDFIRGEITGLSPFVSLQWSCAEGKYAIDTQLIGDYNMDNVLAAIAIGKFMGITTENIGTAIASYVPRNSRSQLQKTSRNHLIIDAYNANPTSMIAALENFKNIQTPLSKVLILGDMKELGDGSREEHRKVVDFIRTMSVEKVFFLGDSFAEVAAEEPYQTFTDNARLYAQLQQDNLNGCYILIKGSRSMQLEKTVELL